MQTRFTLSAVAAAMLITAGCDSAPNNDTNSAPSLSIDTNLESVTALETKLIDLDVNDIDNDTVELSLSNAPGWVHLNGTQLYLAPANPDAGVHTFSVIADDGKDTAEASLTLTVMENNPLPALADYTTRALEDEVFYFVMTDRFLDGDKTNNEGDISNPLTSGGYNKTRDGFYHGGDLQGLTQKLSYIEDLGVSAIWLTPILTNKAVQGDSAGYHGYWTLDFTSIDPHLGGDKGLRDFIEAAHERNIKVFFDIVVNHSADVIKFEECHNYDGSAKEGVACEYKSLAQLEAGDDYTPFIPVGEEAAKTPAWLNDIQYYHNQGDTTTWAGESALYTDFYGLDDIDTDNQFVVDGFVDVFKNIVKDFRPDGFRVDTVKHVNTEFWQQFSPAILDYARADDVDGTGTVGAGIPHFTMFGEVFEYDAKVLSYYTTVAKIPSVLDFEFQGAIAKAIATNGVIETDKAHPLTELFEKDDLYSDADSDASTLINFVGNHDVGRYAWLLGNDVLQWEDKSFAKVDLAHAAMYFSRGIPVIYYGAEQGFIGTGKDKAARQDMMPSEVAYYNSTNMLGTDKTSADFNFDTDHPLYLKWREYARVLREHETLRTGIQHIRSTETSNAYAISRFNPETNEEYLVVFNFNPDRKKTVKVPALAATYSPVLGLESEIEKDGSDILNIPVPASSLVILKANGIADMAAPVIEKVDGPVDGSYVSGKLEFAVEITGADSRDIPTYTVTLEQSMDGGSTWSTVATDKEFPYLLYLNTTDIANGTDLDIRVLAVNLTGDQDISSVTSLVVDDRAPIVTLDYEGAAIGKKVAVTFENGETATYTAEGPVTFEWSNESDALVTFFTPGTGSAITADQPVFIPRATVMTYASENETTGALESQLFVNTSGSISDSDNDTGNAALLFDQSAATAFTQIVNIRGSLNGWQMTPMTYSSGTYYKQVNLAVGGIEYKFAASNWDLLNIGGSVSETGLVRASNPANLSQNVTTAGNYNFYLLIGDIDLDGSANEYIHIIDPAF